MNKVASSFGFATSLLLIAVIALSPLPIGSNRDWGWSTLSFAIAVALLLYSISLWIGRRPPSANSGALVFCGVPMVAIFTWATIQTTALFAPHSEALFAGIGMTSNSTTHIAIDREQALTGIMRLMSYCGVFLLSAQLCADRSLARRVTWAAIGSGVAVTIYGWAMQVTVRSCIAVVVIKRPLESGDPCSFSGTFVNSGNYATFAGLVSVICVASLYDVLSRSSDGSGTARVRWARRLSAMGGVGAAYLCALVILLSGLILSASRAGTFAFVMGVFAMVLALASIRGQKGRQGLLWFAAWLFVILIGVMAVSGETLIGRVIAIFSEGDKDRESLFKLATKAISLRPYEGWGLGSFPTVFLLFQPPSVTAVFDRVHNVYLETALELGIPAAVLFGVVNLTLILRAIKGIRIRARDNHFPAMGLGCSTLVATQSLVDFGVQIPACAILYSSILGLAWAQSSSSRT